MNVDENQEEYKGESKENVEGKKYHCGREKEKRIRSSR